MRRLLFLPIERYDERYSSQWYGWFTQEFDKAKIDYLVFGDLEMRTIKTGQFLDTFETLQYKATQTAAVIKHLQADRSPSVVFFMDLWHPGVISLAYAIHAAGLDVTIQGMLHAGTWDPWDMLTRLGFRDWATGFESSMAKVTDRAYVATEFHKGLLTGMPFKDVRVVPYPVIGAHRMSGVTKERLVVWPHRISEEKAPWEWDEIVAKYKAKYDDGTEFVRSKDKAATKSQYYALLKKSKVVVSTARQETFGIAMLEGCNLGALPVVPDRLSYQELYPKHFRYSNLDEAVEMIHRMLEVECPEFRYTTDLSWLHEVVAN